MARLVKVAKELNVGTSTIVEYLGNNGIEVDNKPTAKLSDEMVDMLRQEFSTSMEVKEKANQLIIGGRHAEEEVKVVPPVVKAPVEVVPEPPKKEVKVVPKEVAPPEEKAPPKEIAAERPKIGFKVVDKINLEEKKPKPKAAPKAEISKEKATPKAKESKETQKPQKPQNTDESLTKKGDKEAPSEIPSVMVRAKTPQLAGLKILGKIDTTKFQEKPKKEKETAKTGASAADKPKRKRKRKKITAETYKGTGARGGSARGGSARGRGAATGRGKGRGKDNEVKAVSAKEIEDKIKATMARISGGKGNKRQRTRRDNREAKREKAEMIESMEETGKIQLTEFISVSEFSSLLDLPPTDIIMACMNLGVIVSINQRLDAEIIELVAEEFNREIEFISAEEIEEEEEEIVDDPADLKPRAPIVTVMGHVDHGKTSLLDYIRSANVTKGEAGGITQHIGAYEVEHEGKQITFLDTPGHEAFTAMRARGAKVTDIAIIIVAADDRIMPQTKEAISHAQAAGVPMVFAINKIDKDGSNPDRIKEELSAMNILIEEWGGKFQSQDISALKGTGVEDLIEKVLLEAELLELKANPDRNAMGTVIEASLDKGRGYVTKILIQNGSLEIGDVLVAGGHSGKVKAMFDERGKRVKKAGPSTPVLLLGLSGAPQAGERFKEYGSEQEARQVAAKRQQIEREQSNRANKRISLDEIGRRLALGSFKELNLIIKGDVDGSVEALADSLIKLSVESVQIKVIHKAVGAIAESDVLLASASDAIIIGFQVRPSASARGLAEKEGVQIKTYSIIYEAIDEIKAAMEGMLDTLKEEKVTCEVEVREIFKISKLGTIAGCFVSSGLITRKSLVRVIRDGIVVYPMKEGSKGELSTLKRFKDDVKEVKKGFECGLTLKNFNDIKIGDIVEGYEIVETKQTLADARK